MQRHPLLIGFLTILSLLLLGSVSVALACETDEECASETSGTYCDVTTATCHWYCEANYDCSDLPGTTACDVGPEGYGKCVRKQHPRGETPRGEAPPADNQDDTKLSIETVVYPKSAYVKILAQVPAGKSAFLIVPTIPNSNNKVLFLPQGDPDQIETSWAPTGKAAVKCEASKKNCLKLESEKGVQLYRVDLSPTTGDGEQLIGYIKVAPFITYPEPVPTPDDLKSEAWWKYFIWWFQLDKEQKKFPKVRLVVAKDEGDEVVKQDIEPPAPSVQCQVTFSQDLPKFSVHVTAQNVANYGVLWYSGGCEKASESRVGANVEADFTCQGFPNVKKASESYQGPKMVCFGNGYNFVDAPTSLRAVTLTQPKVTFDFNGYFNPDTNKIVQPAEGSEDIYEDKTWDVQLKYTIKRTVTTTNLQPFGGQYGYGKGTSTLEVTNEGWTVPWVSSVDIKGIKDGTSSGS